MYECVYVCMCGGMRERVYSSVYVSFSVECSLSKQSKQPITWLKCFSWSTPSLPASASPTKRTRSGEFTLINFANAFNGF